jgi:folate-binding protein YgfZ
VYTSPLESAHLRWVERRLRERGAPSDVSPPPLETVPWGAAEDAVEPACTLVATYGELQAEYAAVRRGSGVMDRSDRGVVEVLGSDAVEVLGNILSNAVPAKQETNRAFLLSRQGQVIADLVVVNQGDRVLLDLDRTDAEAVALHVESFVFTEDVTVRAFGDEHHRIEVYGPDAVVLVESIESVASFASWRVDVGTLPVGEPCVAIDVARDDAERVWEALLSPDNVPAAKHPPRAIGWHAFNIARIEAGSPIFHIDFGPDVRPHETGVLASRVSFTKGCYPGQEIVARMESRGQSKRCLVGLRFTSDALPVAGAQVFPGEPLDGGALGEQIGLISSSTISPLLGAVGVAFATVRSAHAEEGATVRVPADGEPVEATVSPLCFLHTNGTAS